MAELLELGEGVIAVNPAEVLGEVAHSDIQVGCKTCFSILQENIDGNYEWRGEMRMKQVNAK